VNHELDLDDKSVTHCHHCITSPTHLPIHNDHTSYIRISDLNSETTSTSKSLVGNGLALDHNVKRGVLELGPEVRSLKRARAPYKDSLIGDHQDPQWNFGNK